MKQLNLPKESQEALLNGGSMFIAPVETGILFLSRWDNNTTVGYKLINDFINDCSPYQIGDGVYFDDYKATIKDIKVVRVQDITYQERCRMKLPKDGVYWQKDVENWYNKQYGNYEDNPYVFLYEVERIN